MESQAVSKRLQLSFEPGVNVMSFALNKAIRLRMCNL